VGRDRGHCEKGQALYGFYEAHVGFFAMGGHGGAAACWTVQRLFACFCLWSALLGARGAYLHSSSFTVSHGCTQKSKAQSTPRYSYTCSQKYIFAMYTAHSCLRHLCAVCVRAVRAIWCIHILRSSYIFLARWKTTPSKNLPGCRARAGQTKKTERRTETHTQSEM